MDRTGSTETPGAASAKKFEDVRVVHGHAARNELGNVVQLKGGADTSIVVDADMCGLVAGKTPNGSDAFGPCATSVVAA